MVVIKTKCPLFAFKHRSLLIDYNITEHVGGGFYGQTTLMFSVNPPTTHVLKDKFLAKEWVQYMSNYSISGDASEKTLKKVDKIQDFCLRFTKTFQAKIS
jgi:hypothetical protein